MHFSSDIKFSLPNHTLWEIFFEIWKVDKQSLWKLQNIGMEDYLGRNSVGEMQIRMLSMSSTYFVTGPILLTIRFLLKYIGKRKIDDFE